jgi:DNA-binding NarL/FixJ family response regulator
LFIQTGNRSHVFLQLSFIRRAVYSFWPNAHPKANARELHEKGVLRRMAVRILVVDDRETIREAVRSCIETNTSWQICGEAENGNVALDMVRELNPDIIVLDLSMPGMNGLELARQVAATAPHIKMIMFTANDCEQLIKEAESTGISKVVAKSGDSIVHHLLTAIKDLFHERDAA